MSLQDATADSDLPKSSAVAGSARYVRLFSYEGNGSVKDRLLTALYVLAAALALSIIAISVPYGGLLVVCWAVIVSGMSAFEVARLFARDVATLQYRPAFGAVLFAILAFPTIIAAYVGTQHVINGVFLWKPLFLGAVVAAQAVLLLQVFEGRSTLEQASAAAASYTPALLLVSICAPLLVVLASMPNGVQLVWWLTAVVALNDAGAYFVGRAMGRTKLAPALSPNKTIEGSVAGMLLGTAAGVLFWQLLLGGEVGVWLIALISLCAVCTAQCGDLSKSYLKRLRGVKDTGAIFPGHGGILDRFDGMIGASTVVVCAFALLGFL